MSGSHSKLPRIETRKILETKISGNYVLNLETASSCVELDVHKKRNAFKDFKDLWVKIWNNGFISQRFYNLFSRFAFS